MRDVRRVYVLGAGSSRFAGYPLAPGLWSFVRDRCSGHIMAMTRRDDVIAAMENIIRVDPPLDYDQPNLEELFTLLDLSILIPHEFQLRHADWKNLRPKVTGLIADAFVTYQSDLGRAVYEREKAVDDVAVDPNLVRATLDAWVARVRTGDVIISFNWDLLHEAALWRAGKWSYRDGYGFPCRDDVTAAESTVHFYKLHGSVNWAQHGPQDVEVEVVDKSHFFPGALDGDDVYLKERGQWDDARKLIIPTYLKTVSSNALLVRLWNKAAVALRCAEEIVVVGYRLHPADSAAHYLFATALADNRRCRQVQVVSPGGPSQDTWDALCAGASLPSPVRIRKRFEEWVLAA